MPSITPTLASEDSHARNATARRRPGLFVALERSGLLLVLAALVVFFTMREPAFLNVANLFSILQAVSIVALLGIGVTITLAAGGFDLSVGSIAATAQMA